MSFSSEVKDELMKIDAESRHCQIAELTALFLFHAKWDENSLSMATENVRVITKTRTLLLKLRPELAEELSKETEKILIQDPRSGEKVLQICKLQHGFDPLVIQQDCCKRAFARGAFLSAGSVNSPEKTYHFEIDCVDREIAKALQSVFKRYEIEAKLVNRKKNCVMYLKDAAMIVDALNLMGAHKALMEMESVRVMKEVRNQTNRKVNCDIANINKTLHAAQKQIEDIRYIEETKGLKYLKDHLREVAELRLSEPDLSLQELGEQLSPPVSKSCVNHRLKKIGEIAESLRENA